VLKRDSTCFFLQFPALARIRIQWITFRSRRPLPPLHRALALQTAERRAHCSQRYLPYPRHRHNDGQQSLHGVLWRAAAHIKLSPTSDRSGSGAGGQDENVCVFGLGSTAGEMHRLFPAVESPRGWLSGAGGKFEWCRGDGGGL
jgi:hypothetical protein